MGTFKPCISSSVRSLKRDKDAWRAVQSRLSGAEDCFHRLSHDPHKKQKEVEKEAARLHEERRLKMGRGAHTLSKQEHVQRVILPGGRRLAAIKSPKNAE